MLYLHVQLFFCSINLPLILLIFISDIVFFISRSSTWVFFYTFHFSPHHDDDFIYYWNICSSFSANAIICHSESISTDRFSKLWIIYSFLFACMVIFYCQFYIFGAGLYCSFFTFWVFFFFSLLGCNSVTWNQFGPFLSFTLKLW